jgi:hypothetical protein
MIYEKPAFYTFSHVAIGFAAVWFPVLGALMIIYQLAQLILDVRFFVLGPHIKKGNSWQHTTLKLAEMGVGYGLGLLVRRLGLF